MKKTKKKNLCDWEKCIEFLIEYFSLFVELKQNKQKKNYKRININVHQKKNKVENLRKKKEINFIRKTSALFGKLKKRKTDGTYQLSS